MYLNLKQTMSVLKWLNAHWLSSFTRRKIFSLNSVLWQRSLSNKKTSGEVHIESILKKSFPNAKSVQVNDISGGCGDMYEVHIESTDFAGKRTIQQHKSVTNALKEEVPKMHGLRIFTSVPS